MDWSLARFSMGVGDRFARQAAAQLEACRRAALRGVTVTPVWNKSDREHKAIGSSPESVRAAADEAVRKLDWRQPYFVDADHITFATVDRYLGPCDFFTLDVSEAIGKTNPGVRDFLGRHPELSGQIDIPGVSKPLLTTDESAVRFAAKYLPAVAEAARIYRRIRDSRERPFVTEVSMDETDAPQTPVELLIILAAIADFEIPVQTIAPKFSGRFNKGVDYAGDVAVFAREFEDDLAIISHAVSRYRLPAGLKLSVHSGSDKFSLYGPIGQALRRRGAGVHLKTAGTTWLEEVTGLAEAGGRGLDLAKEVYEKAYFARAALCESYAAVIDIHEERLPEPAQVRAWTAEQYTSALRHDPSNPAFNPDFRQLLHVAYKIAANLGERYLNMVEECAEPISRNVTANLFNRHISPLFLAES
jgi:tagaturonate epimerase